MKAKIIYFLLAISAAIWIFGLAFANVALSTFCTNEICKPFAMLIYFTFLALFVVLVVTWLIFYLEVKTFE